MYGGVDHHVVVGSSGNTYLIIAIGGGIGGSVYQAYPVAVFHKLDLVVYNVAFRVVFGGGSVFYYKNTIGCSAREFVFDIRVRAF